MITVQIDDSTLEGQELMAEVHKRPASAHRVYHYRNGKPEGYLTAEEWRDKCKRNISEIFRKHEQGLL
jgi:hypothetical protein